MRGKTISSGQLKIILNVFKHLKKLRILHENAVITLTFKVSRIGKHEVKIAKQTSPNRKKKFNKLDEFNLGVARRMIHQFDARGESLANIYFFKVEISSKICKNCVEHVKHVEKSYWKTDRITDTMLDKLQITLEVEDSKDDNSEYSDSTEEEIDE